MWWNRNGKPKIKVPIAGVIMANSRVLVNALCCLIKNIVRILKSNECGFVPESPRVKNGTNLPYNVFFLQPLVVELVHRARPDVVDVLLVEAEALGPLLRDAARCVAGGDLELL